MLAEECRFTQITAEGIRGRFRQVLNNTNFVDAEGTLTLGVLTFNQFGPKDLKVGTCTAAIIVDLTLKRGTSVYPAGRYPQWLATSLDRLYAGGAAGRRAAAGHGVARPVLDGSDLQGAHLYADRLLMQYSGTHV